MGRVSQRQNGEKMRLGVKQVLTVVKLVDFGVYLGSDESVSFFQRNRFRTESNWEIQLRYSSIKILPIV